MLRETQPCMDVWDVLLCKLLLDHQLLLVFNFLYNTHLPSTGSGTLLLNLIQRVTRSDVRKMTRCIRDKCHHGRYSVIDPLRSSRFGAGSSILRFYN